MYFTLRHSPVQKEKILESHLPTHHHRCVISQMILPMIRNDLQMIPSGSPCGSTMPPAERGLFGFGKPENCDTPGAHVGGRSPRHQPIPTRGHLVPRRSSRLQGWCRGRSCLACPRRHPHCAAFGSASPEGAVRLQDAVAFVQNQCSSSGVSAVALSCGSQFCRSEHSPFTPTSEGGGRRASTDQHSA